MQTAAHRPQSDVASLVGSGQHGRRRGGVELEVYDTRSDNLQRLGRLITEVAACGSFLRLLDALQP